MNRLLWTCSLLLAAAWLAPLHVLPWVSWHNEALATAAVLVGCAGALAMQYRAKGTAAIQVPTLAVLPLFIAAWAVLQWAFGRIVYGGSVLAILSYALLAVAAAAAGHAAARSESASHRSSASPTLQLLATALLAVGLLQVVVVFSQVFTLWSGSDWVARTAYETRGGGNVAQPNHAAHVFLLAFAAAVYLRQAGRVRPVLAGAALVMLCAGLATTQSRSGMLALAALFAWYVLRRAALPVRPSLPAAGAVAALAVALFAAWPVVAMGYWHITGESVNLTTSGRTAIWAQLVEAVWMRPWFGWGVGQVAQAQNAIAHAYPMIYPSTYAHNLFLDLALWIGLPAALLAIAMMLRWLAPRVAAARSLDTCFCVALAIPLAVQAMTEFPYAYSYFLAPVFFALGMLDAWVGRGVALRMPRHAAAGVLALWIGGTAWATVEYVRIEEDFRVARFEALRVGKTPVAYEVPEVTVLTQLGALLRATRVQPEPGMPPEDIALLRDIAMLHPWGATNFRYATALALNGQLDEAARQLQVLRAMQDAKAFARLLEVLDEMAVQYPVLKQLRQP